MSEHTDIPAERLLLGGLLDGGDPLNVMGVVSQADFSNQNHSRIFEAINTVLNDAVTDINPFTVAQQLERNGYAHLNQQVLEEFRAEAQLGETQSALHVEGLAGRVKTKADERHILGALQRSARTLSDPSLELPQKVNTIQGTIMNLTAKPAGNAEADLTLAELFARTFEGIRDSTDELGGLSWGLRDLDIITNGLEGGKLYVVGGRPAMGKTWFGLMAFYQAVVAHCKHALLVSLEMPKNQMALRLVGQAADAKMDRHAVRNHKQHTLQRIKAATQKFDNERAHIVDDVFDLTSILAHARRLYQRHGLGLIAVDYLQLVGDSGGHNDNRNNEIGRVSRALKQLAMQLDVPVLALSQLSRTLEGRADKRPMLSDLRESGGIEQDADTVMFLYRDAYYHPNTPEPEDLEVIVAKNRSGKTGPVKVSFDVTTGALTPAKVGASRAHRNSTSSSMTRDGH